MEQAWHKSHIEKHFACIWWNLSCWITFEVSFNASFYIYSIFVSCSLYCIVPPHFITAVLSHLSLLFIYLFFKQRSQSILARGGCMCKEWPRLDKFILTPFDSDRRQLPFSIHLLNLLSMQWFIYCGKAKKICPLKLNDTLSYVALNV